MQAAMDTHQRILLVDDDPDLLDMYREILTQLPSQPEVHTASSGPRALAMLEAEPFDLLICDLKMPKMDGLQVLGIVRRKYPRLLTMMLSAELDEQFRHRAYALGADLYCHYPCTEHETKVWLEQVESLLERGTKPRAGMWGRAVAWWWWVRAAAKMRVSLLLASTRKVARMVENSRKSLACWKGRSSDMAAEALALLKPNAPVQEWCQRGEVYYHGMGVYRNSPEAVKWFRWAARRGFAKAQCWLGYCCIQERGIKKDMAQGVRWLQEAAKQGQVTAEYNLGVCFEGGLGISKDTNEMIKWYRKAANQGHLGAHFRLGIHYTRLLRIGQLGTDAETREGLKWLERAAEKGHVRSQLRLGDLHSLPEGQFAEAVKWYRKAAESGSDEALAALGRCFEEGRGVPQDYGEALKQYEKAADSGGKHGQYRLGCCYAQGRGVVPDSVEASKWFRQAAERGCEDAQFEIGKRYGRGDGVPQNPSEEERWLREATRTRPEKDQCSVYSLEEPTCPTKPPAQSPAQLRNLLPLRIVMLDDESLVLDALKMMLHFDHPNLSLLTFTNAESALQELEWKDPDLFTTDFQHPGKKADELLGILAKRKVKYPVFVISAYAESLEASGFPRGFRDQGLNVSLVSKPFLLDDLRRLLSRHLGLDYPELGNSGG